MEVGRERSAMRTAGNSRQAGAIRGLPLALWKGGAVYEASEEGRQMRRHPRLTGCAHVGRVVTLLRFWLRESCCLPPRGFR